MTNLKTKLATGMITATVLAGAAAPAFAATTVTIKNNGALSQNGALVVSASKTKVTQTNNSTVVTNVGTLQNTGGNASGFNVGGGSTITTGNATSTVTVGVSGGTNTATVPSCGCQAGANDVTIQGNGAFSWNGVAVVNLSKTKVAQTNNQTVVTNVGTAQNTGLNMSGFNVGGGGTTTTGDTTSTTTVVVGGGENTL